MGRVPVNPAYEERESGEETSLGKILQGSIIKEQTHECGLSVLELQDTIKRPVHRVQEIEGAKRLKTKCIKDDLSIEITALKSNYGIYVYPQIYKKKSKDIEDLK